MPVPSDDFKNLLDQARQKVPGAAEEFMRRYGEHVLRVVRRRLAKSPRLRVAFDSFDFTQEVWRRFFTDWALKKHFPTPEEFVTYLTRTAVAVVRDEERKYLGAQKRDLTRNLPLNAIGEGTQECGVATREPSPDEAAARRDEWEWWLRKLPPRAQEAFRLLREGHSIGEVAERLGVSEKTIRRLCSLRQR
jgi:RNA polymerase sigma factor (sigma-70 family)